MERVTPFFCCLFEHLVHGLEMGRRPLKLAHCDVKDAPRGLYDRRPPHQLTPQFKTVIVTDALRRVAQTGARKDFTITIVAVVSNGGPRDRAADDPLQFESVSLITYQDPSRGRDPPAAADQRAAGLGPADTLEGVDRYRQVGPCGSSGAQVGKLRLAHRGSAGQVGASTLPSRRRPVDFSPR